MRKYKVWGAGVFVLAGILVACGSDKNAKEKPIRIGWQTHTEGNLEPIWTLAKGGAILGLELVNESGGVLGRSVELVTYDDKSSAAEAAALATQSLNDGIAGMFGGNSIEVVEAMGEALQAGGLPYIDALASAPEIAAIGDKVFMAVFGDNTQAAAAAEFAQGKGWRTAHVIWDESDGYSEDLKDYFVEAFDNLDGTTIEISSINHISNTDPNKDALTDQLDAALAGHSNPDFFYISTYVGDSTATANYMRDTLQINQPILGGDGWDDPSLNQDNIFYTNHSFDGAGGPEEFAAFATAYEDAYGERPSVWAALVYDSLRLILSAVKRANSASPADVATALASTQAFEGATGTISYAGTTFHVPDKSVFIVEVHKDAANTLAASFVPENVPVPDAFK